MADSPFPEIYGDSAGISVGPYGVALTLFLSDPMADEPFRTPVGRVRVSVELARAIHRLLGESLERIPEPEFTTIQVGGGAGG